MTIEELMKKELPLNCKEKFFTGTVFPMIVCRDNFKHFHLFLSLLGLEGLEIRANPNLSNIQFFTEYNLRESIYDPETKARFGGQPERNDTPDILILITGESKTLISIEAKMYDVPESYELMEQMSNQEQYVLKWLETKLKIQRILQYALLPKELSDKMNNFTYPIITWDDIHSKYKEVYTEDYFLALLRISLDFYGKLVARRRGHSGNCERIMRGEDIYNEYKSGILNMKVMGRKTGLKAVLEDIASGRWRKQLYETSSGDTLFTHNWLFIDRFINEIDKRS